MSIDYTDKYYLKIRGCNVKHYTKSHIAIDVESRIILYSQAVREIRHNTKFTIGDKAYDTELLRHHINEENKTLD